MGGIFQSDIFIQAAIELGLDDMRKNSYLIDHMMEDLLQNKYVREKYGNKQVKACKEWFSNNKIEVNLKPRDDRDNPPCVNIYLGPSTEKPEMKTMGDLSPYEVKLLPKEIGKPIPFIVDPFVPEGYEIGTGTISVPSTVNLGIINPGMILVNPDTGIGYMILDIDDGIQIEPGQQLDGSQLAIVPKYPYYKARIEHTWNEETYIIDCGALDPQSTIFLWSIVLYSLFRYRQSLLEANGMAESVISSNGGPEQNTPWTTQGGEKIYARTIKISCQTEDTWLEGPHRIIESVSFAPVQVCKEMVGGIKIASNQNTPSFIEQEDPSWTTVEDDEEIDDEDE